MDVSFAETADRDALSCVIRACRGSTPVERNHAGRKHHQRNDHPAHEKAFTLKQLAGLWRDTWWLWMGFAALSMFLAAFIGWFFLALIPCLPVPFVYFAINRYDEDGNEKADL